MRCSRSGSRRNAWCAASFRKGMAGMAKEILCGFGVDVDAVAGWLGSYGGEDSPDDISRGLFAGEVGSPRLLKLFERFGIKTTWFIPGHSIETFPAQMQAVADAGHEIGIHGYSHENPIAMTPRAGRRRARQMHRPRHQALGQAADRLRRAVVGVFAASPTSCCWRTRHQIRPFADASRFPALLRARRRQLDQDRLFEEAERLDGAAQARPRDRPDRDPRELVSR